MFLEVEVLGQNETIGAHGNTPFYFQGTEILSKILSGHLKKTRLTRGNLTDLFDQPETEAESGI